jgi:glucokinase
MNGRPWLVADLGGTNARLALADPAKGTLTNLVQTPTGNVTSLAELIAPYLSDLPARQLPTAACVAVAGPITGDWCEMTNALLRFSISQGRQDLDLEELLVGFRERFETHPNARSYLSSIATALITVDQPGLFGAYRLLRDHACSAASTL